jgi:hypothetical protein
MTEKIVKNDEEKKGKKFTKKSIKRLKNRKKKSFVVLCRDTS